MTATIVGALLPIVITLLLGFFAGWHKDFNAGQATVLNRMVMLYALPLSLFAGMVATPRDRILSEGPLALAILFGMVASYAIVFFIARYLLRSDLMRAALLAIAIGGPAVPFVGVSVLGHLFGAASAVPIAVAAFVMNLIQVPATLMLLSAGRAQKSFSLTAKQPPLDPATYARSGPGGSTTLVLEAAGRTQATTVPTAKRPALVDHVIHALREPVVWAPLVALVLVIANLHLPASVQDALLLLGRATGGVALFASGIVLFAHRVAVNLAVGVSVAARNIAVPGVVWALMLALGMPAETTREAVLTLAIPTASIAVILAVQYQAAEQEMASVLFFSTIFSLITMGGFIWLTA